MRIGPHNMVAVAVAVGLAVSACVNQDRESSRQDSPSSILRSPAISAIAYAAGSPGQPDPACHNPSDPWGPVSGATQLAITAAMEEAENRG